MRNSTLDSSFVNRLKQILADRYGKGLQIRQLMDLSTSDLNADDVIMKGNDLHITIRANEVFLGTAVVPAVNDLSKENRHSVTQLVRMVLEPAMYKWYLDTKEFNLYALKNNHLNFNNIRLFKRDSLSEEDLTESLTTQLMTHLIHLEGLSATTNKKMALQLHELTAGYAFVPLNDVKEQLQNSQDISRMGAMTIYVENVEALSLADQELLLEYANQKNSINTPLIVTSSSKKLTSFSEAMNPSLVKKLSASCFDVSRAPLNTQGMKEVLELFFMSEPLLDA